MLRSLCLRLLGKILPKLGGNPEDTRDWHMFVYNISKEDLDAVIAKLSKSDLDSIQTNPEYTCLSIHAQNKVRYRLLSMGKLLAS